MAEKSKKVSSSESGAKAQRSLQEWSDAGRRHSNTLLNGGGLMTCKRLHEGSHVGCLQKEDARVRALSTRGGFAEYDANNMCSPCAAYWHAERSAQVLHAMNCAAVMAETETRFAGKRAREEKA